ncbi:MAG: PilZ domain-containing protein [Defluviitaleaceae bacterium]|nr:PilZ domain-containing protein [Defluviitaleaceae bacterium]
MSLSGSFVGNTVLIYTPEGEELRQTTVSEHDKTLQQIEVRSGVPLGLKVGDVCSVLIMTQPVPIEFKARVTKNGTERVFVLFKGKEKEGRKQTRYKVNFPARLDNMISEGRVFPLLNPLEVRVINISKSGVRFAAPVNSLMKSDKFSIIMKLDDGERSFVGVVRNLRNFDNGMAEYGCRLMHK